MKSNPDEYRWKCPEGHVSIESFSGTYRCRTCNKTRKGKPIDTRGIL